MPAGRGVNANGVATRVSGYSEADCVGRNLVVWEPSGRRRLSATRSRRAAAFSTPVAGFVTVCGFPLIPGSDRYVG